MCITQKHNTERRPHGSTQYYPNNGYGIRNNKDEQGKLRSLLAVPSMCPLTITIIFPLILQHRDRNCTLVFPVIRQKKRALRLYWRYRSGGIRVSPGLIHVAEGAAFPDTLVIFGRMCADYLRPDHLHPEILLYEVDGGQNGQIRVTLTAARPSDFPDGFQ